MAEQVSTPLVTFERDPASYRHWSVAIDPPLATVTLQVDPEGGLRSDYTLKTNSYDLAVDIELYDIVQRLRFEHPEVGAVVLTGGLDKIFCAGANIQMLATSSHHHKVNFCKFTNETRNAIEDATEHSRQVWLAAINGTAAGGGYELALASDEIILIDDRASSVSLPEVPLLGVLPGTGGLTRLVDKRKVRRDRADEFATRSEGVKGQQAVEWGLVDSIAPRSRFDAHVRERALARATESDRPRDGLGVALPPPELRYEGDQIGGRHVAAVIDRALGAFTITIHGPTAEQPADVEGAVQAGPSWWPLAACRELDHVLLHLRFNEPAIGTWVLATRGDLDTVVAADELLAASSDHWFTREVRLYWARTLKRLDLSARSLVTLIDPGSCFAGTLAELVLAADRSLMLDGTLEGDDHPAPALVLGAPNDGWYPMANGISRLQSRFWGHDDALAAIRADLGKPLLAPQAAELGLVSATPDDLDWEDDVRLLLEERASFSPDALTGLEANLRFVGPETIESKIFARLTAWQNWIFQRPNASGPEGALRRYGSGSRAIFDRTRV